jgi:hypothetical protein
VTLAGYGDTGVGTTGQQPGTFGTLRYGRNRFDFDYDDFPWVYEYDFDKLGDDSTRRTGPRSEPTKLISDLAILAADRWFS